MKKKVRLPAFVSENLRAKLKILACKKNKSFQDFLEELLEKVVITTEKKKGVLWKV